MLQLLGTDEIPGERVVATPWLEQDPDVIAQVRAGDVRAFEQIFTAFYDRLCSFAVEHGVDGDTASDIVQDVMVTFWQRRRAWTITTGRALAGYLFQSVRNLLARHHRDAATRQRLAEREAEQGHLPARGEAPLPPDQQAALDALHADIAAAVDAMPPDRRVAVSLRLYDGLATDEIADILGVGTAAVRMHFSRARGALAAVFEKHRA